MIEFCAHVCNNPYLQKKFCMKHIKHQFLIKLAFIIALSACSSGKSAFEHGNYYEAVITSVNRAA
jgi:hypothetical protein